METGIIETETVIIETETELIETETGLLETETGILDKETVCNTVVETETGIKENGNRDCNDCCKLYVSIELASKNGFIQS